MTTYPGRKCVNADSILSPFLCDGTAHLVNGGFRRVVCGASKTLFSVREIFRCTRIGVGTYSVGNITGHGSDHDDAPTQILFLENACAVLGRDECTDHTIQSEQNTAY